MRKELATAQQTVEQLKAELALKGLPPFCGQDFKSDSFIQAFQTSKPGFYVSTRSCWQRGAQS